jgi:uncharacterized membrane protein YtjA (UPF0391 family)
LGTGVGHEDGRENAKKETGTMSGILKWAVVFFVLALIAAVFGFGGIAAGAAGIAKILFIGFLIIAGVALAAGLLRRA